MPIISDWHRALKFIPKDLKDNEWVNGILHIKNKVDQFLEKNGIQYIKTIGEKFNPLYHEAIGYQEDKNHKEDIILEEIQPGFQDEEGEVLIPAKVIINKKMIKNK